MSLKIHKIGKKKKKKKKEGKTKIERKIQPSLDFN